MRRRVTTNSHFLDVNISREKGVFITVYRKPTFSGVYTNFSSFIPTHYKHGLVMSLLYRCFHLCSDLIKFHHEVSELKLILGRNGYPSKVIDFCIRNFLNKINLPKKTVAPAGRNFSSHSHFWDRYRYKLGLEYRN